MNTETARHLVMERWLALPPDQRSTQLQASFFALKSKEDVALKDLSYELILGWLMEDLTP